MVGIGETSPDSPLHITYADNTTSATATGAGLFHNGLKIENTSTTNEAFSQLHLRAGTGDAYIRSIYENTNLSRLGFFIDNSNAIFEAFSISSNGKQISGSASSTGSFGRMEIHSAYGPTAVISVQDGYHAGGLRLQGSTRVASPGSYIELNGGNYAYGSAVFNYGYNQTNSELSFQVDGTERIHFGGLGKITATSIETIGLASAGGDISGSASSTGSFGVLKLDKYNGGIGASTNTLYGVNSGGSITTGGHNSALGNSTLGAITTGDYNVALGSLALQTHTTGDRNVGVRI